MTPDPVYYMRLQSINLLQKYVNKHLVTWYKFLRDDLGRDIENGDLRVVYGCRKSTAFGIATVLNSGRSSESTELTFSVDESWIEAVGCKYHWHHRGSAEVKAGPSIDENADIRSTGPGNRIPLNQCLFISSLDFRLSDEEWADVDSGDGDVALSNQASHSGATSKSMPPRAPPGSQGGGSGPSITSCHIDAFGMLSPNINTFSVLPVKVVSML